jgi:hypothetical protein
MCKGDTALGLGPGKGEKLVLALDRDIEAAVFLVLIAGC